MFGGGGSWWFVWGRVCACFFVGVGFFGLFVWGGSFARGVGFFFLVFFFLVGSFFVSPLVVFLFFLGHTGGFWGSLVCFEVVVFLFFFFFFWSWVLWCLLVFWVCWFWWLVWFCGALWGFFFLFFGGGSFSWSFSLFFCFVRWGFGWLATLFAARCAFHTTIRKSFSPCGRLYLVLFFVKLGGPFSQCLEPPEGNRCFHLFFSCEEECIDDPLGGLPVALQQLAGSYVFPLFVRRVLVTKSQRFCRRDPPAHLL